MSKRIFSFSLMFLLALVSVFALEDGQVVRIVNRNKTLSVQNSSVDANKPVEMWTETSTNSQRWTVVDTGRGTFQFVNVYSGLCLGTTSTAAKGVQMMQIAKAQAVTRGSWELVPVEGQENTYVIYMGTARRFALSAAEEETDGALATLQMPEDAQMHLMQWQIEVVEAQPNYLTPAMRDDMMEKWKTQYYHKADVGYVIGKGGWWGDAEMFEVVLDALETTGDQQYATMFDMLYQNFCKRNGTDWSGNEYNDDIAWMCIACVRAYLLTGKVEYRTRAKANFDKMYARANAYGNGTLVWKQGNTGTNSCINGPAAVCACYLGIAFNQKSYFDKAAYIYSGERSHLYNINSSGVFNGQVYDSYSTVENKVSNTWSSTYNQGTCLGAAVMLYNYFGTAQYKSDADAIMTWTAKNLANSNGIIKVCQTVTGDLTGFKGILLRYIRRYAADLNHPEYYDWLAKNAYHAWNNRNSKGISMSAWLHKTTEDFYYSDGGNFATDGVGAFTALSAAFNAHLGVIDSRNAYERMEAESFNFLRGVSVVADDASAGSGIVGPMKNQQYIGYRNVDFGTRFASDLKMRVNFARATGTVKVYADDPERGTLIATVAYANVQETNQWVEVNVPLELPITGNHRIYLVGSGVNNVNLAAVDWFQFESNNHIYADITNNGGKLTCSSLSASGDIQKVVDDDPTTELTATVSDESECWIQYESASPVLLQGYAVFSAMTDANNPVSWTLQAGNDGETWVDLDRRDSVPFVVSGQMVKYDVPSSVPYTFYRLLVRERKNTTALSLSEWQLLGQNISSTDITADGGEPAVGSELLFDHDVKTVFALPQPTEVTYTTNGGYILSGYSLTAQTVAQAPASWTLSGSTNGRTWTDIDVRTDEVFPYDGSTMVYVLSDVPSYSYYRISFNGEEGNEAVLAEVQLLGAFDFGAFYPDVASVSNVYASDGDDVQNLVDKDGYTCATVSGENMKWSFDFPIPTKIIAYSVVSGDNPDMDPLDVTMEGKQDDESVSTVSTRTLNFTMPGARFTYSVSSSKLFTHADFNILTTKGGGNAARLADFEIYGTSIAPEGDALVPSAFIVTASRDGLTTSEGVANLTDYNKVNMYRALFTEPLTITFAYPSPQCIDTYAITSSKSDATRDPKSWVLEASEDGEEWIVIDSRTGETFSNRYATQFYGIENTGNYTHYRLTIKENGGESQIQIGEIQLLQFANLTGIGNPVSDSDARISVSSDVLTVRTGAAAHLSIYDMQGRLQLIEAIPAGETQVSVRSLPVGTYVASLLIDGKRQFLKFIK